MPNHNLLPITAIIITHRQDDRLKKCLNSLTWVDEILLVLSGGLKFKADLNTPPQLKIINHQQSITNFAKVRNHYFNLAKHEWVLFLDSDESFEDDSFEKIKLAIHQTNHQVFTLARQDVFHSHLLKYGEVGNVRIIRLIKKGSGQFMNSVHEVFETLETIGQLDLTIRHQPHINIAEFFSKISFYATLAGKQLTKDKPHRLLLLLQLGAYPALKFIHNYFLKLGWLDGFAGFIYAYMMSLHSFIVRVTALEILNAKD